MLVVLTLIFIVSCKSKTEQTIIENKQTATQPKIQVQGHRGDRGNMPENSIEGFLSALHKGVDAIELDLVISKDHQVVVSHEHYMSSSYMSKPSGEAITQDEEKKYNLYQMTYDSIKKFDSGSRGNKNIPSQNKIKTHKPLLSEVFDVIEKEIKEKNMPSVKYNIEIKSNDGPSPAVFVDLVMQIIQEKHLKDMVNIQCFDPIPLNILNKKHPDIEISFLVSKGGIESNLKRLNFNPEIYSPYFNLIKNHTTVDSLKALNIKLITWTVNNKEDIKRMIELQVDGIITDYPELVLNLL